MLKSGWSTPPQNCETSQFEKQVHKRASAALILFAEHVERCLNMLEHDLGSRHGLGRNHGKKCLKSAKVVCCQTSAERPGRLSVGHSLAQS